MRAAITAVALGVAALAAHAQELTLFSFAAGSVTGGYFSAARAICGAVNDREDGKIYCSPEPTSGSLYNLEALAKRQVDFALVQSDWHRYAYEGLDLFEDLGAITEMRSVMSLYPEAVTIVAHADSGIESSTDLFGKRIDIGHRTSGRHATLQRLLGALRIDSSAFADLSELSENAAINELCAGRIDAVVLIVGHPNRAVGDALDECDVQIRPFYGPDIDSILGATSDYQKTTISSTAYPQMQEDVRTYAVTATVVTHADADPRLVGVLVEDTLDGLEGLRNEAQILSNLDPTLMASTGLSAPMHEAAVSAFEAFAAGQ